MPENQNIMYEYTLLQQLLVNKDKVMMRQYFWTHLSWVKDKPLFQCLHCPNKGAGLV